MPVQLLVREDLSADLVHALTAELWAALPRAGVADVTIEGALDGLAVPLHAGAERFYRERGLLP